MDSNILSIVERISSNAPKGGMDFVSQPELKCDIQILSDFLDINHNQAILFSCLLELSLQRTVTIDSIAKHLKCSTLKVIANISELEFLERKSLIQKTGKGRSQRITYSDFGYSVPFNIIEALRTSDKGKLQQTINFSLPNFLERVFEVINSREEISMSTQELFDQIEFLTSNNNSLPFIQYINKNVRQTVNKCIVFSLAYYRFKKEFTYDVDGLTQAIFDDLSHQLEYEQNLAVGRNELFKNEIVCFHDSQFANDKILSLTHKTIKVLYRNFPELKIKNETEDFLVSHKTIQSKTLFFEPTLNKQLEDIVNVLNIKHLKHYQKRLESKRLSIGVTIIFFGKSGAGKTESVYQIARQTKRDILIVDLSQLRSKWFGDSEKIVKRIFDDYRRLCNSCHVKPILLFNEADGLFSKRVEMSGKSASIDHTINTVQNILLQELEKFDGIMFATTNLVTNLDNAFERRFLFKIEFKNPLPEVSQKIWQSRLPELSQNQMEQLSDKYRFSGGEIENIVRKYVMDSILVSHSFDFNRLVEFCELEKPFHNSKRMGYLK